MSQLNETAPDVFILCGGKGTRFRELRNDIPKALAPINGVPFIDLLLKDLVLQGCRRIILGTGYLSDQIELHLKQRNEWEYLISVEKSPLGTGGAIRNALPLFESEQVLVLNGDSYIDFSVRLLQNFHITHQADATILLSSTNNGKDYGNVKLGDNHKIISFQEKPKDSSAGLVNAGVYFLQKKMIERQPEGIASLERDWFPIWLKKGRVLGMVIPRTFHDIGTAKRFHKFVAHHGNPAS